LQAPDWLAIHLSFLSELEHGGFRRLLGRRGDYALRFNDLGSPAVVSAAQNAHVS